MSHVTVFTHVRFEISTLLGGTCPPLRDSVHRDNCCGLTFAPCLRVYLNQTLRILLLTCSLPRTQTQTVAAAPLRHVKQNHTHTHTLPPATSCFLTFICKRRRLLRPCAAPWRDGEERMTKRPVITRRHWQEVVTPSTKEHADLFTTRERERERRKRWEGKQAEGASESCEVSSSFFFLV